MKVWYKSKTVWINLAAAVLTAAESQLHVLQPVLGERWFPLVLFSVFVVNAVIRFATTQPITLQADRKP